MAEFTGGTSSTSRFLIVYLWLARAWNECSTSLLVVQALVTVHASARFPAGFQTSSAVSGAGASGWLFSRCAAILS